MRGRLGVVGLTLAVGCGRLGFDTVSGLDGGTSPIDAAAAIDATPPAIALVRVQSGTITLSGISTTLPISAVNPSRAFLVFGIACSSTDPDRSQVAGELSGSGEELVFRRNGIGADVSISWQVAEFSRGVTVQRGDTGIGGAVDTVALSPVDVSTSFPLVTLRNSGGSFGDSDFVRAALTGAETLEFAFGSAPSSEQVFWQVVSMDGVVAARGELTLNDVSLSAAAEASLDPATTWLTYSFAAAGSRSSADIADRLVSGDVVPGAVSFERDLAGATLDLAWHAVDLGAAATVQRGTASFEAADQTATATLPAPIDMDRTIVTTGYLGRGGRSVRVVDANPCAGWATARAISPTQLEFGRGLAGDSADLVWSAIEF